jgi:broad specificity phosphatase PhoE
MDAGRSDQEIREPESMAYLLRHGESATNVQRVFATRRLDPPLSEAGVRQAAAQADALGKAGLVAIYASTLRRARETAEMVGHRCGLPVTYTDALREVHVGVIDGKSIDDPDNYQVYREVVAHWQEGRTEMGFPGGETLDDVARRFRGFIAGLESQDGPVLMVGHGVLFMAVIWLFCDNRRPVIEDNYMGRGHLSELCRRRERFRLVRFNVSPKQALQGALLE